MKNKDKLISQPLSLSQPVPTVLGEQCPVYVNRGGCTVFCVFDKGHAGKHSWELREAINHPQHYGGDWVYEPIKVIQAWGLNFALGSVLKYIYRAGKKEHAPELEDLQKAQWYLKSEIEERTKTKK
jgi:hypothetical protein